MKFSIVPVGLVQKILNEIHLGLIDEFKKPKFESHYITKIKEIKKLPKESIWDFDQIIKKLMVKVSF